MNFVNVLFGIAIGDAFGAGIEFQSREWIREHIDFTEYITARKGKYAENYIVGNYTDDTEMTIGIIKALRSQKVFTPDLLVQFWIQEYESDKERKGYGRQGHGAMKKVYTGEKTIEEIRSSQQERQSPGNAPPMRAIPLGYVQEELIDTYAIINADATHPHPKARAASIIVARAAQYLLLHDGNPQKIISYCKQFIRNIDCETEKLLDVIDTLPAPEKLKKEDYKILCGPQPIVNMPGINGLPSDAMLTGGCALYILKHARSTMEALRVSIYMGGDVDSLASICTGIAAGRYGIETLPPFMIEKVEGKEYLAMIAHEFEHFLSSQL